MCVTISPVPSYPVLQCLSLLNLLLWQVWSSPTSWRELDFRGTNGDKQRAQMQSMLESSPGGIVQSPAEVAEQVYMAAIRRKDEVFVGPAYNAINAMHRTFGVNPFSMARP